MSKLNKYLTVCVLLIIFLLSITATAFGVDYSKQFYYGGRTRRWIAHYDLVERTVNGKKYIYGHAKSNSNYWNGYNWSPWYIGYISVFMRVITPNGVQVYNKTYAANDYWNVELRTPDYYAVRGTYKICTQHKFWYSTGVNWYPDYFTGSKWSYGN